jgi:hypothetical protein
MTETKGATMEDQLRARLAELTDEFEKGQEMLRAVEAQQRQLTETLLRISGARQVLLELLGEEEQAPMAPAANGVPSPAG